MPLLYGRQDQLLFPGRAGNRLSRDAVERRLATPGRYRPPDPLLAFFKSL